MVEAWCPVDRVTGSYGVSEEGVVRLIRMNWRMVVLELVAKRGAPMSYNAIARESGLNSRTLATVLKELTKENLLDRKTVFGSKARAEYTATIIGKRMATMPCPLLRFAADRNNGSDHGVRRANR